VDTGFEQFLHCDAGHRGSFMHASLALRREAIEIPEGRLSSCHQRDAGG
jgi:hypothetical protein